MELQWSERAWGEYNNLQNSDKQKIKKINTLIKDIKRNGSSIGIGNPEPLKNNLSGYFSRQINEKDRLVYKVENDCLTIVQCDGHYDDK